MTDGSFGCIGPSVYRFWRSLGVHLKISTPLLVTTLASGVFAYAALAINGRVLGPSDFGLLGALVGVIAFAQLALRPLAMAATHHAIMGRALTSPRAARELVTLGAATAALLLLPFLALAALLAEPLDQIFHASGRLPIALVGALLAVVIGQQVVTGVLLGAHRFFTQGIVSLVDAAARALATFPGAIVFGVSGSLAAYLFGQIAAAAAAVIALGGLAWSRPSLADLAASGRVGMAATSLVLGSALLQNGDLVVLRWYGQPAEAGLYAACASVGTLLVAVSVPLYTPSFPRVIAALQDRHPTRPILISTLALVLALGGGASLVSLWLGAPVLRLTFGPPFADAAAILPVYLLKTSLVVAVGVVGQHALAVAGSRMVGAVFPVSIVGLAVVALAQPGPDVVVLIFGAVAAVLAGALLLGINAAERQL